MSATTSAPIYKYVTIDVLNLILKSSSIRFTQPTAFNDPFELLPEVVIPADLLERRISIPFDVRAKRRHPPVGEIDHVPDNWRSSDAMSRQIVQQLNTLIGTFCMSRRNDSLLMWAHYANDYTGAVVEFDSTHDFFADQIEVEYQLLRPKRHIRIYTEPQEPLPVSELCVKSTQWEYENEVRIIRRLSECEKLGDDSRGFPIYIQRIHHGCIKSIILGERMKVDDQRDIYTAVKDTNIALSLAAIDHTGYAFRHEIIKFNAPVSQSGGIPISPKTAHIFSDRQTLIGEFARLTIDKHPMSKVVNLPV